MQNQPDYKKAFEESILYLCKTANKEGIDKLKEILSSDQPELETFWKIYNSFPQFRKYFHDAIKSKVL